MPSEVAPPRQLSLPDRHVIVLKLAEVYVSPESGYDNGWSDKRVADDLGVPRAWVEKIREENFGPLKSSLEARQFLEEAKSLLLDGKALAEATASLSLTVKQFDERLSRLQKTADRIEKSLT